MVNEPLSIKEVVIDGVQDRLRDPIVGAFCVSFLIVNWDMIVVLLNYKGAFHENIHFIKSAFYPFVFGSKQLFSNESYVHWIDRVFRPWHLLRWIVPVATSYVWLFRWPTWSRDWFKKINEARQGRVDMLDEIKEKSLEEREKAVGIREENLSLKEKIDKYENEIAKFEILLQQKDQIITGQNYDLQGLEQQLKGSNLKLKLEEVLGVIKGSGYNFLREIDIQKILELNNFNAKTYSPSNLNVTYSRKSELENFVSIAKANGLVINFSYNGVRDDYSIDQVTWT